MKYANKKTFVQATTKSWNELWLQFDQVPKTQLDQRVTLVKGGLAWAPKDVYGHVHAWHRLLLDWHKTGLAGKTPKMPMPGFTWRQTPEMNRQLFEEFRQLETRKIIRRLKLSHGRVMKIVDGLSNRQLMFPGRFNWTGKLGIISYVSANTDSHYRWATKKIKRIIAAQE